MVANSNQRATGGQKPILLLDQTTKGKGTVLFSRGLARTLLDILQGNTTEKKAGVEAGNEAIGSLYTLNKRNTNSNSVW